MNLDKQQILQLVLNTLKKVPGDISRSAQSAVNISPPVDLARRFNTNRAYEPYGGVPFEEQQGFAKQNIKDAIKASKLIGYASPLRLLKQNPLTLKSGEQAVRLGSGRGWEIFDRVTGK